MKRLTNAYGIVSGLEEVEEELLSYQKRRKKRMKLHQKEDLSISSSVRMERNVNAMNFNDTITKACCDSTSKTLNAKDDDIGMNKDIEYIVIDDSDDDDHHQIANNTQLTMEPIKRVDIGELDARKIVTRSRRNGEPIVIVGHKGWVNFAKPWLRKIRRKNGLKQQQKFPAEEDKGEDEDIDLADLQYEYILDKGRMIYHIGEEYVPYSMPGYDEENPVSGNILAKLIFAQFGKCEGHQNSKCYLSQWQFPLSKSAAAKLCYKCKPLPFDIFGDDLLKYYKGKDWPQCFEDNPYREC